MKKNLLFVMPSLAAGGGEKSLVNLLSQIDYKKYNVDLFLLNHNGIFMEYIPKEVQVLTLPDSYSVFTLPLYHSLIKFLLKGKPSLAIARIMFTLTSRNNKNTSEREQYSWKYISEALDITNKKYDVAIGFLEKTSTYFCVDKVNATKKIGWVHIDYDKLGMDPEFDIHYFKKLDNIVTVSQECASILKRRFPSESNKVDVIYNVVSPSMINKMAIQGKYDIYDKKDDEVIILSIGRLHYQKGFEMAIEACKKLVDKGYNIRWYIIGEGEEREKLLSLIKTNKLEKYFKLLGLKSNPYPYLKQADIYAQTSRFEGKSIAIDEAKILQKPILVTNYSTAKDQITNEINGVIVEMNSESIGKGMEKVILDNNLRDNIIENLSKELLGTEEEINKLYKMF
ncbi:glycosyltransferase [Halalkalibacter alkalisediminis]|uniref:Glycosyltransferase n=1 Tax=Halalkalibacter alkalisediminis TaxID=935616 RepID=A0ABV6NIU6_9BACI|nr:glycosyltransferase [Halalkalibacter alkalisediminis]